MEQLVEALVVDSFNDFFTFSNQQVRGKLADTQDFCTLSVT